MNQAPGAKAQLLTSIETTIHHLLLLLWQEPQHLNAVLHLYENLYHMRELLKDQS